MIETSGELLAALEPLPYRGRMKRLAEWARVAPRRAEVCAELRGGGAYQRRLALVAAMVGGDVAGIGAATRDPDPAIRMVALRAALRAGVLGGRQSELALAERRRIYRTLRRLKDPVAADALIAEVRARHGDEEAAAVLPACGPETVRALLPDLEHAVNLTVLAARHPQLLLARVAERLVAAAPDDRPAIWWQAGHAVLTCATGDVLDLLERYGPEDSLPGGLTAYGRIARDHPERVAALLVAPGRITWTRRTLLPPSLLRRLAVLPDDRLAPLARRLRDFDANLAGLLEALPPARRGAVHDAAQSDRDTAAHVPAPIVMEALPAAIRIREATRVLTLPKIREREATVLAWSAQLAWPEASAAMEPALGSGDAEERATGYRLLVEAARRSRDPQAVAQVLERLARLRNEQDPVRAAALTAFAGVARLLTAAAAPRLTRLTTDVTDARDTSATTTSALSELAAHTLQHHVTVPELRDWALFTIDRVTRGSAAPVLRRFDTVLRRGQEEMVFERLRPWVENAMARGWYGPLFALTGAFGRRAWSVPGLQELLGTAAGPHTLPGVASRAIGYWLECPRGRGERVAEVLAADPSAVTIGVVWETLCRVRTDLLDDVLIEVPEGRFLQHRLRWAPGPPITPSRWLTYQQELYVSVQGLVVRDAGQSVWARVAAIRAAARVPDAGRALVLRWVDTAEVPLAEAALGALIWTDRPDEALPLLLGYAGGDRARVALYAAGRAAAFVPPDRLPGLLGPVLTAATAKVTSRKEAARLLARYGPPAAMTTLLDAYRDPGTHRDVRAAIVSAARQNLHADGAWAILGAAGGASREERRAVLAVTPGQVPERHRPRYAGLIVAACTADDREVRRAALQSLPQWSRWAGDVTGLVVDRLTDLGETLTVGEATGLLRALRGGGLHPTFRRLVAADESDQRPGRPGTDRPARRRIETVTGAAARWSTGASMWTDRSGAVDAVRALAGHPGHLGPALTALVSLGRLDNLDEIADRCEGRPLHAVRIAEHVAVRARELPEEFPALPGLAELLAARGDLAGGLFAVALIKPGQEYGWAAPWRTVLQRLREHPVADVRDAAFGVRMI